MAPVTHYADHASALHKLPCTVNALQRIRKLRRDRLIASWKPTQVVPDETAEQEDDTEEDCTAFTRPGGRRITRESSSTRKIIVGYHLVQNRVVDSDSLSQM